MPKLISNALSAPAVKHAKPGRHADGGGLFLLVKPTGKRSWLFRYKAGAKVRDMGLGAASGPGAVKLSDVRETAIELRKMVRAGKDPLAERDRLAAEQAATAQQSAVLSMTFQSVAEAFIEANKAGWRNAKHRAQWTSTLETYAFPVMGKVPVAAVGTAHVSAVIEPIWTTKPETASRVRGRIEAVLDYARAREWREGENPARWRGHFANILPARNKVARVRHHAALAWQEIGNFMADLRSRDATAARALEFAILTAARTGEVLGARWCEIDLAAKVWTVPGARMKAGREHRVALSTAALSVLEEMGKLRPKDDSAGEAFLFPGAREARPLSQMAMLMLLRRMGRANLTAHGFRSTFRDWIAETTAFPGDLAEMALAHTVSDKVEAAYRRGDMIERRRRMMEDWATFCALPSAAGDNVQRLRGAA